VGYGKEKVNEVIIVGVYKRTNNDRYEGEFKNSKMHGKGKYYYANGDTLEGNWADGKLDGKGKLNLLI